MLVKLHVSAVHIELFRSLVSSTNGLYSLLCFYIYSSVMAACLPLTSVVPKECTPRKTVWHCFACHNATRKHFQRFVNDLKFCAIFNLLPSIQVELVKHVCWKFKKKVITHRSKYYHAMIFQLGAWVFSNKMTREITSVPRRPTIYR